MPFQKSSTGVLLPRLTRVILCAVLDSRSDCYDSVYENLIDEGVISSKVRRAIRLAWHLSEAYVPHGSMLRLNCPLFAWSVLPSDSI